MESGTTTSKTLGTATGAEYRPLGLAAGNLLAARGSRRGFQIRSGHAFFDFRRSLGEGCASPEQAQMISFLSPRADLPLSLGRLSTACQGSPLGGSDGPRRDDGRADVVRLRLHAEPNARRTSCGTNASCTLHPRSVLSWPDEPATHSMSSMSFGTAPQGASVSHACRSRSARTAQAQLIHRRCNHSSARYSAL